MNQTNRRVMAGRLLAAPVAGVALLSPLGLSVASAQRRTSVKSVNITGTFTDAPGAFAGALKVTSFAENAGKLVANGTLSGTVKNTQGTTLATLTNQAVQLPVQAAGTCEILDLTLGPLDLNLLGLRIQLNQINLRITAQQGGGLLGDLLCAIANLLNPGGLLSNLVTLLNQLFTFAALLALLQNLAAAGTAAVSGALSGAFTLDQAAVQNGQMVGVGTLTGTVSNLANQQIGAVTNQAVTLPLQVTATCEILTLTLGPLDLNLLGLRIQLSQVNLRITAQQGPGNLLGNLLCGLANLLNSNGALSGIVQALNRILAVF